MKYRLPERGPYPRPRIHARGVLPDFPANCGFARFTAALHLWPAAAYHFLCPVL